MSNSPILGLRKLSVSQSGKEEFVNENNQILEVIFGGILDKDLATPPSSPSEGDAYIIAASPTGAWSGQAGKIAYRYNSAWYFLTPLTRWGPVWVADELASYRWNGTDWVIVAGTGDMTKAVYDTNDNGIVDAASALKPTSNVESLTETKTLILTNEQYQYLTPNGANREVTLPASGYFIIVNNGAGTNGLNITLTNGGTTQISLINSGDKVRAIEAHHNGTNWILTERGYYA